MIIIFIVRASHFVEFQGLYQLISYLIWLVLSCSLINLSSGFDGWLLFLNLIILHRFFVLGGNYRRLMHNVFLVHHLIIHRWHSRLADAIAVWVELFLLPVVVILILNLLLLIKLLIAWNSGDSLV